MLRSRIYGPIYSGYVPFHTVKFDRAQLFASRLRDWKNPSDWWISVKHKCLRGLKRSFLGGDRTAVPSDENLRSERSTTELASPGLILCYYALKAYALQQSSNRSIPVWFILKPVCTGLVSFTCTCERIFRYNFFWI